MYSRDWILCSDSECTEFGIHRVILYIISGKIPSDQKCVRIKENFGIYKIRNRQITLYCHCQQTCQLHLCLLNKQKCSSKCVLCLVLHITCIASVFLVVFLSPVFLEVYEDCVEGALRTVR